MHIPIYSKIYRCQDVYSTRPFKAGIELDFDRSCNLLRGDFKPSDVLDVKHCRGLGTPKLVIWTGFSLLIHEKIIKEFIEYGITGWEKFDINLIGKHNENIVGYYGISITGRCGPLDYFRSEIVYRNFPGGSFPYFKGSYFENDYWDGTDIFMENPDENGPTLHKYVSERVAQIFDKYKVKNLELTALTETEINVNVIKARRTEKIP